MPSSRPFLFAASILLAGSANALFSQGTISDRDYQLSYTGYNDTTAFCTAFRSECVDYVGALNYHHNLDCVVSQTGPTIHAWCGGVEKDANGDTGSGPALDFTQLVCPETKGCTITKEPEEPVDKYSGSDGSASSVASSTAVTTTAAASSVTNLAATSSSKATEAEEEVPDSPPTDASSLATAIPSTATWATFASQASAPAPTLLQAASGGVSSIKTGFGAVNAAASITSSTDADAESGASTVMAKAAVGGAVAAGLVAVLFV